MNQKSFVRKLGYIVAIIFLAVPLYILGQPKSGVDSGQGSVSTLANIRERHRFGQTELGKLDPASQGMRLGTLGLRGVATSILWNKAEGYKRKSQWDRFAATLDQISLLQPHFVRVWEHQAHNLTYNISVEFDDYEQRFEWVKKGIAFLIRGTTLNERQPILEWYLGIYNGQKIGKADEKVQYREIYRDDDDFHEFLLDQGLDVGQAVALGPDQKPDNWLVGRLWFEKSYDLVADGAYCKKTRHIYYSDSPKCRLEHANAIESEGILDDRAKFAWSRAGKSWKDYGDREVRTTDNFKISMNGEDNARARRDAINEEFEKITVDARERVRNRLIENLTAEEREVYENQKPDLSNEERVVLRAAQEKMRMTTLMVADAADTSVRDQAIRLATELEIAERYMSRLKLYKNQVNYDYWADRALAEQSEFTLAARRDVLEAEEALDQADAFRAIETYERAFAKWKLVFDRYPLLIKDTVASDVFNSIRRYKRILDAPFAKDFPLLDFIDFTKRNREGGFEDEIADEVYKMRQRAKLITNAKMEQQFAALDEGKTLAEVEAMFDANGQLVEPTTAGDTENEPDEGGDADGKTMAETEPEPVATENEISTDKSAEEGTTESASANVTPTGDAGGVQESGATKPESMPSELDEVESGVEKSPATTAVVVDEPDKPAVQNENQKKVGGRPPRLNGVKGKNQ